MCHSACVLFGSMLVHRECRVPLSLLTLHSDCLCVCLFCFQTSASSVVLAAQVFRRRSAELQKSMKALVKSAYEELSVGASPPL